jgi:hypothetical protein
MTCSCTPRARGPAGSQSNSLIASGVGCRTRRRYPCQLPHAQPRREQFDLAIASEGLSGLAAIASLHDELERAARLYGAAAAHRYDQPQDAIGARLDVTFFGPARMR